MRASAEGAFCGRHVSRTAAVKTLSSLTAVEHACNDASLLAGNEHLTHFKERVLQGLQAQKKWTWFQVAAPDGGVTAGCNKSTELLVSPCASLVRCRGIWPHCGAALRKLHHAPLLRHYHHDSRYDGGDGAEGQQ
jgi:hypothetical protein